MNKEQHKKQPLFHLVKRTNFVWWQRLLIRGGSILLGLLVSMMILFIFAQANPGVVFVELFKGVFGTKRRILNSVRDFSLLLCVGLALIPAFKMKFWNLGGNGQILISALMCIVCMFFLGNAGLPDYAIILIMIPVSILSGVIWALIPGIFKAFFNTNESLFTLMMNYIATGLVAVFISAVVTTGSGVLNPLDKGNIPGDSWIICLIVAIVMVAFIFVYLRFSKHGYELEVVGESKNTARYIGINVKKVILRTVCLSGALCGVVGLLLAGSIDHTITADTAKNMGFTAIMVAWLAKFNPFVMIGTSFLITFLNKGMAQVQTACGITNDSITNIVIGIIYFCIIASEFFITYRVVFNKNKGKEKKEIDAQINKSLVSEVNSSKEEVKK